MPNARVSVAGGAMAAPTMFIELTPTTRVLIENVIEDLILLLDKVDDDENREPSFDFVVDGHHDEQEDENEHGGDIQDVPHGDADEDDEDGHDREEDPAEAGLADMGALDLYRLEALARRYFDGSGQRLAQALLAGVKL